ncbi:hypothetical protein J5F16_01305 [Pseudomonas aeruginosa]|nr:hypothetical protein [Pseudomonas aeruginosa]MBP8437934.1 hypothetical protein [Pseudomonas aeruginosa]MBP8443192.1 hypothetical protein [Pseudomonas aeruginosa]MBP8469752.1 hypothetical protein [Pseudomonas aeruginosa]MBP8480115.1 hypothetical protein [Pseudomonas aeruginosa]MBP8526646.1 hypothetical protein [Pseudomonas aeruginosa]
MSKLAVATLVVLQFEIVEATAAQENTVIVLKTQVHLGHHLGHLGEQRALLEIEVAVIRVDQRAVIALAAIGAGDQPTILALHSVAHPVGQGGI